MCANQISPAFYEALRLNSASLPPDQARRLECIGSAYIALICESTDRPVLTRCQLLRGRLNFG